VICRLVTDKRTSMLTIVRWRSLRIVPLVASRKSRRRLLLKGVCPIERPVGIAIVGIVAIAFVDSTRSELF